MTAYGPSTVKRVRRTRDALDELDEVIVKAIAEGTIQWEEDPDFGYLVATSVPDFDDPELLQPRRLYERQGRLDEYEAAVKQLKAEREEYMRGHAGLRQDVFAALK